MIAGSLQRPLDVPITPTKKTTSGKRGNAVTGSQPQIKTDGQAHIDIQTTNLNINAINIPSASKVRPCTIAYIEACSKIVHTRAQCMSAIRKLVSAGDAAIHLVIELQADERQRLLGALEKDGCKVVISPDEALEFPERNCE